MKTFIVGELSTKRCITVLQLDFFNDIEGHSVQWTPSEAGEVVITVRDSIGEESNSTPVEVIPCRSIEW
jgi:hypothetical protein